MAAWRRAIELSLTDADTAKLKSIAQSRTEPASRVERARILLAYREDPSVELAIAEAISWLVTQGLLVPDLGQPAPGFYVPTRRAQSLKTRTDVDAFRKGRILPSDLLPTLFAEKVVPLFRRGDHDIAVFQAFKEVEVAVRNTANAKGAGYSGSEVGTR